MCAVVVATCACLVQWCLFTILKKNTTMVFGDVTDSLHTDWWLKMIGVRQMPRSPAAAPDDFNSPYSARNQPGMSTMYTQQGKGKNKPYIGTCWYYRRWGLFSFVIVVSGRGNAISIAKKSNRIVSAPEIRSSFFLYTTKEKKEKLLACAKGQKGKRSVNIFIPLPWILFIGVAWV